MSRLFILLMAVFFCGAFLAVFWFYGSAKSDFRRLLKGSNDISIMSVQLDGQGKRVFVNDKTATAYLSAAMRNCKRGRAEFGFTYGATIKLSTGGWVSCAIYLPEARDKLTVLFPVDEFGDGEFYFVPLPAPIPDMWSKQIDALR